VVNGGNLYGFMAGLRESEVRDQARVWVAMRDWGKPVCHFRIHRGRFCRAMPNHSSNPADGDLWSDVAPFNSGSHTPPLFQQSNQSLPANAAHTASTAQRGRLCPTTQPATTTGSVVLQLSPAVPVCRCHGAQGIPARAGPCYQVSRCLLAGGTVGSAACTNKSPNPRDCTLRTDPGVCTTGCPMGCKATRML
jgi:hypothetical protein